MALSIIRFDMRAPGLEPAEAQQLYEASLEMGEWADARGFDMLTLSEHHASDDGYLPSPLVLAAAMAARTTRISLWISALLMPLHDPIRLAEDLAVLDLISNGRLSIVTGLGYRPIEYEMMGKEWGRRGRLLDECLDTVLQAWTGEPFEYRGRTVQVTPRPVQRPHPTIMIGGGGAAAAKRAARLGFSMFPSIDDPELYRIYQAECERLGTTPGFVGRPAGPGTLFVSEDPDRTWDRIGPYLLHDAVTYRTWQPEGQRSHVKADATSVEELRAEGVYQVLTPDECVAVAGEIGPFGAMTHHPLCGATPPEYGWESLELYVDQVLPRVRNAVLDD
jgi:alkanesulfonate monooxygenase SsuD/methylene tetrahydromethanopterin reductase-like flavin-dependent oxidoreductase (luciferase family)